MPIMDYMLTDFWDEYAHPILKDEIRGGPFRIAAIVATYVLFVTKVGPAYMRDRKPFELAGAIKVYNIVNIIVNTMLFAVGMSMSRGSLELWHCERTGFSTMTRLVLGQGYLYLKIFDLLDTVFFVLRKKQRQVTTLHVWHHASMPLMTWVALKYYPLTPVAMTPLLNTFIHIMMYSYYYMAADPILKQYLWWKKYITLAQLVQFTMLFAHGAMMVSRGCGIPTFLVVMGFLQNSYMIYAFSSFYLKEYNKDNKVINEVDVNNNKQVKAQ